MAIFNKCLYIWLIEKYEFSDMNKILLAAGLVFICIIVPYILGSLNFAIIISKLRYRDDIRNHGSGNAGATNMLRTYGKGAAAATMAGDMLKCAVSVVIGGLLFVFGDYIAGLFCVLGHMMPCFYKFKGGKGVAAMAVVVLMTNWVVFLILLFVFVCIVLATKYVSLASIMCALLYPIFLNALDNRGMNVIMAFLIGGFVFFMHRGNIKRLFERTESKVTLFDKKKNAQTDAAEESAPEKPPTPKVNLGGLPGGNSGKKKKKKK